MKVQRASRSATRVFFRKKSTKRTALKIGLIALNLAVIATVVGFFVLQPRMADNQTSLASATVSADSSEGTMSPLDQLSSATIALTVARMSNLPETVAITNQADSEDAAVDQAATADTAVATKPQVVASKFVSAKDIQLYIVKKGDTVRSIASQFDVTSDSVRWSNNLTGNQVSAGKKLYIPPINGIVYLVGAGDNADTLAAKFNADKNKIVEVNDAEISGLKPGQRILIPGGTKASMVAHTAGSFSLISGTASYGYNGYDYGYCTYWVAVLRQKAGNPVPTNLGNASTWAVRAAAYGLPTGSTPRVGAAVVLSTVGAGHVAYVTAVNDDGSITISEMNHVGWNRTDERRIPGASSYRYVY